jgi:hypothetical protein
MERRAIAHAFEVEHTTTIYSDLLRMADLLTMQPRIDISLHIVSPAERREQMWREIVHPVFSVLEGGPISVTVWQLSQAMVTRAAAMIGQNHATRSGHTGGRDRHGPTVELASGHSLHSGADVVVPADLEWNPRASRRQGPGLVKDSRLGLC